MEKTMENFDLKRLPQKAARQVKALLDGTFLDRKENVLAFGNPGSGKTHLLSALGQDLIRNGRQDRLSPPALVWFRIFSAPSKNCG